MKIEKLASSRALIKQQKAHYLVSLLIIPVESPMLNLPQRLKLPPQHKPHPLQQVARHFDMTNIRRVILGIDIVVLQDPLCIKVINESTVPEMLMHLLGFFLVELGWLPCHSLLDEWAPL